VKNRPWRRPCIHGDQLAQAEGREGSGVIGRCDKGWAGTSGQRLVGVSTLPATDWVRQEGEDSGGTVVAQVQRYSPWHPGTHPPTSSDDGHEN